MTIPLNDLPQDSDVQQPLRLHRAASKPGVNSCRLPPQRGAHGSLKAASLRPRQDFPLGIPLFPQAPCRLLDGACGFVCLLRLLRFKTASRRPPTAFCLLAQCRRKPEAGLHATCASRTRLFCSSIPSRAPTRSGCRKSAAPFTDSLLTGTVCAGKRKQCRGRHLQLAS